MYKSFEDQSVLTQYWIPFSTMKANRRFGSSCLDICFLLYSNNISRKIPAFSYFVTFLENVLRVSAWIVVCIKDVNFITNRTAQVRAESHWCQ